MLVRKSSARVNSKTVSPNVFLCDQTHFHALESGQERISYLHHSMTNSLFWVFLSRHRWVLNAEENSRMWHERPPEVPPSQHCLRSFCMFNKRVHAAVQRTLRRGHHRCVTRVVPCSSHKKLGAPKKRFFFESPGWKLQLHELIVLFTITSHPWTSPSPGPESPCRAGQRNLKLRVQTWASQPESRNINSCPEELILRLTLQTGREAVVTHH